MAVLSGLILQGTALFARPKGNTVQAEWYVRLTAEIPSEQMKDKNNILGQLHDSVAGYDSHDLLEMAPFGSQYLTIVFPHPDWEEKAGDYASDYHAVHTKKKDSWQFEVHTSSINSDVILSWDKMNLLSAKGKHKKIRKREQKIINSLQQRMWLEDVDTGEKIDAVVDGEIQSYTFNMNDKDTRTFRWVLDRFGRGHYHKKNHDVKHKEKKLQKMIKMQQEERDIDLVIPPGHPH